MMILLVIMAAIVTLAVVTLAVVAWQLHRLMEHIGVAYVDPVAEWRRKAKVRGTHYR